MIPVPLVLSATNLAKAYDLACPRFLTWSVDDVPRDTVKWDETPGGQALAEFGNRHEADVVAELAAGTPIHEPLYPRGDLEMGAEATRTLLESGVSFIAQAVFVDELVPGITLRGMADLVRRLEGTGLCYQILEVKASQRIRTSQMLQAWCYWQALSRLLGTPQPNPVLIDRSHVAHPVTKQTIEPVFEEFLSVTIPSWLDQGDEAFFRSGRCISCPFEPLCLQDALERRHISLVAGLGPGTASRLRSLGGNDMLSLQGISEGALHSAGFESNYVRHVAGQARAFAEGICVRTRDRTPLPSSDVEIFLEAEADPTSSFPCRCGLLKRDRRKELSAYRGVVLEPDENEARRLARAFLDLVARQASRAAREGLTWQVLFYGRETIERLSMLGEWASWSQDLVDEILVKAADIRSLLRRTWHLPLERYDLPGVLNIVGLPNPMDDIPSFVLHTQWKTAQGDDAEALRREMLARGEHHTRAVMQLWDWLEASWDDAGHG